VVTCNVSDVSLAFGSLVAQVVAPIPAPTPAPTPAPALDGNPGSAQTEMDPNPLIVFTQLFLDYLDKTRGSGEDNVTDNTCSR